MGRDSIGEFEELVLMAVAALDGKAYGLSVRNMIRDETEREVSLGAIHATLYRLQDKGLLDSNLEGATSKRGGRRKRMFTVTGGGVEMLREVRSARARLLSRMPTALQRRLTTS